MSFTQTAGGPSAPSVGRVIEGAGGALFIATGAGVHRSTDGGLSWSPLANPAAKAGAFLAAGGGKLYTYASISGSAGGIYQSSDNGDNWTAFNTGLPRNNGSIAISGITADANNIYVLAFVSTFANQVFRSPHASAGFTSKHPQDVGNVNSLAVSGANLCLLTRDHGVYWSSNSGNNWTSSGINGYQGVIAVGPDGATVYLHASDGNFKSTDSCQSFTSQTVTGLPALASCGPARSLGVDASNNVYRTTASSSCGIYKSTDGGAQYSSDNDGLMATLTARGVRVAGFSRTSSGFFAGTGGSGLLLDHAAIGWTRSDSIRASVVIAVASRGGAGQMIAATSGGDNGTGGGIFVTDDGGATWTARNTGLSDRSPSALLVDGANLLVMGQQVWRSTNDAMQWNASSTGIAASELSPGGQFVKGPDGIYLRTRNKIYKSVNGGQNWSDVTGNLPSAENRGTSPVDSNNPSADANRVYLMLPGYTDGSGAPNGDAGVWHTTTGTVWTHAANNNFAAGSLLSRRVFATGTALLAGAGATLYRSTDNGDNWTPTTGVAVLPNVDMQSFLKDKAGALYLGGGSAGLFVSFDDGVSWTPDSDGLHPGDCIQSIEGLATDGAKIYAAQGGAGVFTSNPAVAGQVGDSVACTHPAGTSSGDTKTVSSGPGAGTTVSTTEGTIMNLTNTSTAPSGAPAGYSYPHGFFNFDITGLSNGATVTVTLTLPVGAAPDAYIKCNASGSSCAPFAGAVFAGRVVTLTLVDGGAGDADELANGVINDPGALAVTQSSGGGGDGGALGLNLLLPLLAAAGMRRRRPRNYSSSSTAARCPPSFTARA